jgi:hypothetical protein
MSLKQIQLLLSSTSSSNRSTGLLVTFQIIWFEEKEVENGSRAVHFNGGLCLCNADIVFYTATTHTTLSLLEKTKGTKGYSGHYIYGSYLCC